MTTVTRAVARPMLASIFFVGATHALRNADALAVKAAPVTDRLVPVLQRVAPAIPTDAATLVKANAVGQVAVATALATGRLPRLSAAALALSLVPTTVAGHAFWRETDDTQRAQQKLNFTKNVAVLGGLMLAGVDTEGKPGVAWRARRAAADARRQTRQLAREARREARLAAARIG